MQAKIFGGSGFTMEGSTYHEEHEEHEAWNSDHPNPS